MRQGTLATSAVAVLVLCASCSIEARHKALTTFFDGVPPIKTEQPAGSQPTGPGRREPMPAIVLHEHGPYAAKLCGACHDASSANRTVVPKDELCRQCHELPADWKYPHGPQAAGQCLACHDPHRSKEAGLLVASGDAVCLRCHERATLSATKEHADSGPGCVTCHDAHGSDSKYLLR